MALFLFLASRSLAQNTQSLQARVLRMSHSTRIDDAAVKPWHMAAKFQLYDEGGKPSVAGTLEEWWAGPQIWKITIQSPLYAATSVENLDGDFRTAGAGAIPQQIRAIERDLVYPAPMGEDLSGGATQVLHKRMESTSVDCIQLSEATTVVLFPYYCVDSADSNLKAMYSMKPWSMLRHRTTNFQGRYVALSITVNEGKRNVASAEVTDLTELTSIDGLFSPSPEMTKVTNMHTLPVVKSK
jgi:hypothetical protein